jgi:uncharacterized membrane protein
MILIEGGVILTRIEKSVEIKVSLEKVWEMLAFDRMPEWMDEWKSVKYTSEVNTPEDKFKVGTSAHVNEKHVEFDLEIKESLKNEKIVALSKFPPGRVKGPVMTLTYTLEPVEDGTKLTYSMEYEMPGGIIGKTLGKLAGDKHAEKGVENSVNNLKSVLEK